MNRIASFDRPSGGTVTQDIATITITANYQEYDPPQVTHIRLAYDWLQPSEASPVQGYLRVNPGTPVEIPRGSCEPGKSVYVLEHQTAKISPNVDGQGIFRDAQARNIVKVVNEDGVELAVLPPFRGSISQYPGKVFAVATSATALLHYTVFPHG